MSLGKKREEVVMSLGKEREEEVSLGKEGRKW